MNVAPGGWRYAIVPLLVAPFALIYSAAFGLATLAIGAGILAFFRDPDRTPPPTGVVSPADGKVSVLRDEGGRIRLGVFMNVHHVHVVRSPCDGKVYEVEHSPGGYRPAFTKDSDLNEKLHVRLEPDDDPFETSHDDATSNESDDAETETEDPEVEDRPEVTFIAGAFARRIYPYVEPGDDVARGERIGHIAFGSRVDVLFPPDVERQDVVVDLGDRLRAGETVILETSRDFEVGDPVFESNSTDSGVLENGDSTE